jgi:hypothetical protein
MTQAVGDEVQFVNGGTVIPAGVVAVHEDGTLDLRYHGGEDHPAPVVARAIPACPEGGSFGWQALAAEVAEEAPQAVDQAAEVAPEVATESPAAT